LILCFGNLAADRAFIVPVVLLIIQLPTEIRDNGVISAEAWVHSAELNKWWEPRLLRGSSKYRFS